MYSELVSRSNFSFLRGASHPEELVAAAKRLELSALAIADQDGLYAAVKAHLAAKSAGLKLIHASRMTLEDGPEVALYVQDARGWQNLCALISESRLRHPKGEAGLSFRDVAARAEGLSAMVPFPDLPEKVAPLAEAFPGRFYVGLCRTLSSGDAARNAEAKRLAEALEVPLCAHNDVHYHSRRRQMLQDVLAAIRHQTTVDKAGARLFPNAERVLKTPQEMARLFADCPEAVGRSLELSEGCRFSLDELKYRFSEEDLPPGHTPISYLRQLTQEGLHFRFPRGIPEKVTAQVAHELELIEKLDFPGYFLAIWEIVRFARERGILCQGRGSAANSAVCYALQITSIDPVRMDLLFERFISMDRKEPPDIDVDFEHERREEVLQHVYQKHGRHRAGMVCEVICYRGRLAAREAAKALGLSLDQADRLSKATDLAGQEGVSDALLEEAGLSPLDPRVQQVQALASELEGFPRHLSIHVGGFVITAGNLTELVPVENAAMKDRTVVQWEKDDLASLNILKVDLLGLGMLTLISKCFALVERHHGVALTMATIPAEDLAVYDMICAADTVGVFQIESRAQMNMLPRLHPRCFYDLVVEIALIRPGPIIGDMVHPYVRRRDGLEDVKYPSKEVEQVLKKTLGVPLFQEQAMKLAMVAGGFSSEQADQLRRVLSHKRAEQLLGPYQDRFVEGCLARGYERAFAEQCFKQFRGFAHYGFPESHSASFAIIAYASAYLKRYYPAAFAAALLNSQPMGFYAPHTIVEDARRHGVEVRPLDANASSWDCTLEASEGTGPALRLGLRQCRGLREDTARRMEESRAKGGPFQSIGDLALRARVPRHELVRLALAGTLHGLRPSRREALWEIQALGPLEEEDLFFGMPMDQTAVPLPPMSAVDRVVMDYDSVGLSLEKHPLELLRPELSKLRAVTASGLSQVRHGRTAGVGGMAICRQRPQTAKGFCFISLEDETGIANVVVAPQLFEKARKEILGALFLYAEGAVEKSGKVVNLKARRLVKLQLRDGAKAGAPGQLQFQPMDLA
ncbi:MAG TPA: error-prone DNA polymerase [Myxococcaceae bacterium]|nr:error-prone DNA polymerase [Myxococcaceae bacterium]